MSTALTDDLLSQLRGAPLQQLGAHLDLPQEATEDAVQAALPVLLGGLSRNVRDPMGAQGLYGALERDHRGLDPGNVLGNVLAGGGQGAGILGHVFGSRQQVAANGIGAATGLGPDRSAMLLRILAPIVLAYLARRLFTPDRTDGPHALEASPQGLSRALETEESELRSSPRTGGLLAMLDRDGDGDVDFSDFNSRGTQPLATVTPEMRSPRPLL